MPPSRPRHRWLRLVVLAVGVLLLPACGRKTPVRPPSFVAPEVIVDLSATNAEDGIRLSWKRPGRTADGSHLYDLGSFRVERSATGGPFTKLATVAVTDQERLRQAQHFSWLDSDVQVGEFYAYRVVSFTTDGYESEPSNVASVVRAVPTPRPSVHAPHPTPTAP
jgi:hypothetical protein